MPALSLDDYLGNWAGTDMRRGAVAKTVTIIADTCRDIAALIAEGQLTHDLGAALSENVQGETQKQLDDLTNRMLIEACGDAPVAAIASEELEQPIAGDPSHDLVVAFDPLDGSSNIEVNTSIGTIFSILPKPPGVDASSAAAFLQSGRNQLAAGFVVYGPQTVLMLTLGEGTHDITLHPSAKTFVLSHNRITTPDETREFAVNISNFRYWVPAIQAYVMACLAGAEGPRGQNTNMRWIASLVADCTRILLRGGIYLYPSDRRPGYAEGRLRVVYEAWPIAMLVEQAGGLSSGGQGSLLDVEPKSLHERVPMFFGSRKEVEAFERHLAEDRPLPAA